ncbi:hypothetical protein GH714_012207 [Hevea brasiliensis]|uniref:Flavin-containing monooxygenase n=1 Tax=Hevea brasiliensis TaxID=3981 RepID=A0A6A6MUB8_HEVBR|nr:hypothetical protein GH714_012207 [Hevea brasiliensis]
MESWDLWGGTGKPFGSKGKWHIKVQHTKTCSIEEYHAEFVILCIGQFSGVPNIPEFSPDEGPKYSRARQCTDTQRWGISKFMESYLKWTLPLKKYGMLPKFSFDEHMSSCQIAMLPENFFDKVEEGSIIIKNSQSFRFCREGLIIEGEAQPLETDIVIFATGFKGYEKLANIFESSVFQDCLKATAPLLLYRQILHPRIPQLAIIGYNESFSTLGNSELKSLWLANFLDGNLELPCVKSMEKEAKMWGDHIKQVTGRYFKRACISNANIWYNDQLCKDMGYNPRRKNGFLRDLFIPYAPTDYADLTTK